MTVSRSRDWIGRVVLSLLGAAGVVAGCLGILGLRSPGSRVAGVLVGLAAIVNGAQVVRIARGKKAATRARDAST